MSLLGKGVNKLFTSLGSLLKKIVELLFDLLGLIKFKISKKGYNVKEESSKKGKIAGRKVKNNMDKFAIKAQVGTDKGIIFLGKFLRLFTFGILKLFNTISKNLYKASEKSKDKFTTYNISQDEKNKEKFMEFDNLIAKCNDIENYEEAAISNNISDSYKDLNHTIFSNADNKNFKNTSPEELDYNIDKNIQNKTHKEISSDLDKTLFELSNTYDNSNNDVKEYKKEKAFVPDLDSTLYQDIDSFNKSNSYDNYDIKEPISNTDADDTNSSNDILNKYDDSDLDKTLFQDDANMYNSIKSKAFSKALEDINYSISEENTNYKNIESSTKNNEDKNAENKASYSLKEDDNNTIDSKGNTGIKDEDDYDLKEDTDKKYMFDFLKKKEKNPSFDETFHGENYEFNSSIKLANENYSKNQQKTINNNSSNKEEIKVDNHESMDLKNGSNETQMINMDDFREAVNSRLNSSSNADNKIKNSYRYSLDDDDESIKKFLSDD